MPDISWEHTSEARVALHTIVTDPSHGAAALSDPHTMSNLLKDLLPDALRESGILVAAAEAGLANTLRGHLAGGMDASTAIRLTSSSFSAITMFAPEACDWVTGEFAVALGVRAPGDAGSAGRAAGTSAPDPYGQSAQPHTSSGFQDRSYQPAAPATSPAWQADPDGKPAPARRKRGTVLLIVAAVVVVAAGVTARAVLASGSAGTARSGTESFVSSSSYASGSPLALSLVGVFSASGTQTLTGHDKWLARLPGGTFIVITKPQKASGSVDGSTCALTIRQPGTYTTGNGTGKYAGITGSGTYHLVYTATVRRASNGTCDSSSNSVPVQGTVSWAVHGGGPVTLP